MTTKVKVEVLRGEGHPDLTLEPFFRSREEVRLIRLLQSTSSLHRFSVFFERHGCLRCRRRDVRHMSNGLCEPCRRWFYYEIRKIEKELAKGG